MKKIIYLILLIWFNKSVICKAKVAEETSPKIGLMVDGLYQKELEAINRFLSGQEKLESIEISEVSLLNENLESLELTHIWIHQLHKNYTEYNKKNIGEVIREFVESGGNLILSMEAVRLLNDWGIEKNPFEIRKDSIRDHGFGRPLGFHSFKSHPIFEGLHGGVYPWKSKSDHSVNKIGFFGERLPDTTIAKVIGIEWTYITFHEDNKLILEYQLGKGKIIAIGAFSYFSEENYNQNQLHRLYSNIFQYMAGNIKNIKSNYWNYSDQKVMILKKNFPKIDIVDASKWILPKPTINLKKREATEDVVIMSGRRMVMIGKQKGGIEEIWTNPFMSFRDLEVGVSLKESDSVIWLKDLTPSITSSPELLIRKYEIGKSILKEIITISIDKPVGVLHYEWEGQDVYKIYIKYTSNLRYMWPYSEKITSSISYKWAPEMNAAIISGQSNILSSIMGFSSKPEMFRLGQYDGFRFENMVPISNKTDLNQVSGLFCFDAKDLQGKFNAYIISGDNGIDKTIETYKSESKNFNKLFLKSFEYYKELLGNSLMLTTPNNEFNEGYKWAIVRSDQFFQETPDIGTSMVAGFGTTLRGWDGGQKISGRPGYAWYFGRDGQWTGLAVNAYGGHKMVKKILDVFRNFQSLNGKIYHELTTSGAVHFDASDSTPLYVVLAAHYLKYSGDIEYIREIWPSIKAAMDFCYSTDTDNDNLIEITNVGHGWIEGGSIFGAHTEIYLAGCWAAALDAASYISSNLNKYDLSDFYNKSAQKVRKIIDQNFWNEEGQYFYNGKMKDGSYMKEETVLSGVPIYFDAIIDPLKAFKTAASYASSLYSTDWGVRILPETSKGFNPKSYHSGMVWPLFSGWASLAEYKTGNYVSGYTHIMNNLLMYRHWNLGSVEETLNGEIFTPAGVSSQQAWSGSMVLHPISEGMLGIKPDALSKKISLSPSFPWHWKEVKVDNIIFGNHKINFKFLRTETSTTYQFQELLEKGSVMHLSPSLPPSTIVKKVLVNGKSVKYKVLYNAESLNLLIDEFVINGQTTLKIFHSRGIGVIPIVNIPKPGSVNKGLKILQQKFFDKNFEILIEGLPNETYQFKLMSYLGFKNIINGNIIRKKGNIYTIESKIPESSQKYMKQKIYINLK
tara:strand:- start:1448 stop:4843 length:3396 start_codon:yes stop_codon:yes gene_type:complete